MNPLKMDQESFYANVVNKSPLGFAYHEVLYDEAGQAEDYVFLECNQQFECLLGIKREAIIGKKITEVFPQIKEAVIDWVAFFARVDCACEAKEFEYYSTPSDKTYHIRSYSVERGYILTHINDITPYKKVEEALRNNIQKLEKAELAHAQNLSYMESIVKLFEAPYRNIQELLDKALDQAIAITQSKIGYIYFYHEDREEFVLNTWSKEVMDACKLVEKQTIYQLDKTGLWGEAVRQRKPIVVNDYNAHHPLKKGYPLGHAPLVRYLTLPIIIDQTIMAVVGVANKKAKYQEEDVLQLTILMDSVWKAVEREKMTEALAFEKERLRITLQSIGDAVIATDHQGKIVLMNQVAEDLTGWSQEDALGLDVEDVFKIVYEESNQKKQDPVRDVLEHGRIIYLENHTKLIAKSGIELAIADSAAPIKDQRGQVTGVVLVFRDVTQAKKKNEQILYITYHDKLTGLYNRAFFEQELKRLNCAEYLPLSIIMGDVNGLKLTNDVFGYAEGDELLKTIAKILKASCREQDIIARWGGDEFVVLLPHTQTQDVIKICKRIKSKCEKPHNTKIKMSIALGYATKQGSKENILSVIREAEEQMARHKLLENKSVRSSILASLIHMLYDKSNETEAHAERLYKLSIRLARLLRLTENEEEELKLLSMLHDIGKISMRESIFIKTDPLTEKDWSEIKKHTETGYRIARSIPELAQIAEYILCHHERWDGTGYPQGLKGDGIPLLARILAIAEAYDVMTHDTVYRKARSPAEAKEEVLRNCGTQFDPKLGQIFVERVLSQE